jgi:hypothetical protein
MPRVTIQKATMPSIRSPARRSSSKRLVQVAVAMGAVVFAARGSPAAASNLLNNGSFETGSYAFGGDGGENLLPGATTITGWKVITNDVAALKNGNSYSIAAEDGNISLDLQSYTDSSPYGGVQQMITTNAGQKYELSFWIGVQNSSSITRGPASVTATAGSASETSTNTLNGSGQQWEQFQLKFTAPGSSTTVSLAGTSTAGGFYIGLDNALVVPYLAGDVNFDGVVNGLDIADVASHWLSVATGVVGDANNDGIVNGLDISLIASNWLATSAAGAGHGAAVPEPSALVLAVAAGLALLAYRRRR